MEKGLSEEIGRRRPQPADEPPLHNPPGDRRMERWQQGVIRLCQDVQVAHHHPSEVVISARVVWRICLRIY